MITTINPETDFVSVTELANDEVSEEQVVRLTHRYLWARRFCQGKDVLEIACGAGQGLGVLARISRSLKAGDISSALADQARSHYRERIDIRVMDATHLPLPDNSLDIVIIFEAIYYLSSAEAFVTECKRVLRVGGKVLIATANKDLYDFNPSPFSIRYYGVQELGNLFRKHGFSCEFSGYMSVDSVSWRQRVLRPIKALVVKMGLVPKTMSGKKFLKRLVFGRLVTMPAEIVNDEEMIVAPVHLQPDRPDRRFKVIYLVASSEGRR